MHEIGICENVIGAVLRRAAGRRVTRVRVRAGARHRIAPEAFREAFALLADGTIAHGAVVELDVVPVTLACGACGHADVSKDPYATCGNCGSDDVETAGGDELTLVSVSLAAASRPAAR